MPCEWDFAIRGSSQEVLHLAVQGLGLVAGREAVLGARGVRVEGRME